MPFLSRLVVDCPELGEEQPEFVEDGVAHNISSDRIALAYVFCYPSVVFKTMSYGLSALWCHTI